ncbi:MAG: ORC1-type DNA replication protein 1 [Candidatus Heimdallarchaeota archaeon LC_3]|nr:MAG: ORC1-type DNA replication protein 1 [Candidatus Heimdallarchaeota archaeon LC_3]
MFEVFLISKEIIDEVLFSSSIFKDETTLYHGYVPPKLPYRDNEVSQIAQNFRPLFQKNFDPSTGISANIGVIGSAGIGKTASVRYTIKKLIETAKSHKINVLADYRNCLINRTAAAIFRGILRDVFGVNIRGYGNEEAIDILIRRLNSEDAYLILILDEVTSLPENDIESFLHMTDEFGARHRFFVILISRPTEWNMMLLPEISQRISDVIKFEPYKFEEVKEILEYRAGLAFKPSAYNDELLQMIAEISTSTRNLRHGVEILHRAGRIADRSETSEISPEMVRKAKVSVYPELRPEILYDLNKHELLALLGITRDLLNNSYTAVSLQEAYSAYQLVREEYGEDKKSVDEFSEYLDNLEILGLISSVGSKRNRTNGKIKSRITINDVPAQILMERIENHLIKM